MNYVFCVTYNSSVSLAAFNIIQEEWSKSQNSYSFNIPKFKLAFFHYAGRMKDERST
jgi:hypothetical protein